MLTVLDSKSMVYIVECCIIRTWFW